MDEIWFKLVLDHDPSLSEMNFDRRSLNRAVTRAYGDIMDIFDGTNNTGVFRRIHYGICPVSKTKRNFTCYYITNPGNVIDRPRTGVEFWESISTTPRKVRETKKRKISADVIVTKNNISSTKIITNTNISSKLLQLDYFDSSEAVKLFKSDGNDSVLESLELKINILMNVNLNEHGWKDVITTNDKHNLCTSKDIIKIRQQSMVLCQSYIYAVNNMNNWTWQNCCEKAIQELKPLGIYPTKSFDTVRSWNVLFRKKNIFPHPNLLAEIGRPVDPRPFQMIPTAKAELLSFIYSNLADLTLEMVHDHIALCGARVEIIR